MEFVIREFREEDREQISSLMQVFNSFIEKLDDEHRVRYIQGSEKYFTDKMITEVKSKEGVIFVAENNSKVIGFVAGLVERLAEEDNKGVVATIPGRIIELFVTEDHRREGIGKKLMEKMEENLVNKGCDVIKIGVFVPNVISHNFYKKMGYKDREVDLMKKIS